MLLKEKDPEATAELIAMILARDDLRAHILDGQARVLRELKSTDFDTLVLERLQPVLT